MVFKPAILQCFGDVAQAITGNFDMYLQTVAQILEQAGTLVIEQGTPYDMMEYYTSLREGAMDGWAGIILAMKVSNKGWCLHLKFLDIPRSLPSASRTIETIRCTNLSYTSSCFYRPS